MSETVISIKDLSKSFGDHEVLRKIDIDVHSGEVICIVGSSGSGKSTLLRCINKLEKQTSGKILYHDKEVRNVQKDINDYRSKVGMVFQSFNLFNNMTVLQNCMLCTRRVLHLPKQEAYDRAITHLKGSRHGSLYQCKAIAAIRRTEAASCYCQVALYEPGGAFV